MDLRKYITSPDEVTEAKRLIASTHFMYQPFRITDDLEVGGGYSFLTRQPGAGLIYWPGYSSEGEAFPGPDLVPYLIDNRLKDEFQAANEAIRQQYEGWLDQICDELGPISERTVADIGCFNGYIPVAFSLRGAKAAVGYDIGDRGGCIEFLNRVLKTDAKFILGGYDLASGTMEGCPGYDLVVSMSVLQHMTEPLRHIHFLRSITREALFLVTSVYDDNCYSIRYGEPNKIWRHDFPWCFDNSVYLSKNLLLKALEMAGFSKIVQLQSRLPPGTIQAKSHGYHDYDDQSQGQADQTEHQPALSGVCFLAFVDGKPDRGAADLRLGYGRSQSLTSSGNNSRTLYRRLLQAVKIFRGRE